MMNFLKGVIVGIGGVVPGLSGSIMLIIFGLYQKTLDALGTILSNFRKNIKFLLPIISGMVIGVLLFSKVIDFFLNSYEMPTRYCFLGMILGTVPLIYKEVKKKGFPKKYYLVIIISFILGTMLLTLNQNTFPKISNPSILQSIILGVLVVTTAIIPGVDPAVLLSTLGYYEVYVNSLATVNLHVLLPMILGLTVGGIVISFCMSKLFKYFYTLTFSIIFGLFLAMIPNMLSTSCILKMNTESVISIVLLIIGFHISYSLGNIKIKHRLKNN